MPPNSTTPHLIEILLQQVVQVVDRQDHPSRTDKTRAKITTKHLQAACTSTSQVALLARKTKHRFGIVRANQVLLVSLSRHALLWRKPRLELHR